MSKETHIVSRLQSAFDDALASGDLFFFPSTIHLHPDCGVQFELRLCPALQHKPSGPAPQSDGKSTSRHDPLAPPYVPKLLLGEVETDGAYYVVLLNKFSVIPKHFLLVTKDFQSQSSPLSPQDLLQAYLLLLAAKRAGQNYLAFYNCGKFSGASQPHKHIQFIPVAEGGPPIEQLARARSMETSGPFSGEGLPYANYVFSFPPSLPSSSHDVIMDNLSQAFMQLLDLVIDTMRARASQLPGPPSYNVILTQEHMHVIPRSKENYVMGKGGESVSVNALGYAGLLLARNEIEMEAVKEEGLVKILTEVGLPRLETHVEEES